MELASLAWRGAKWYLKTGIGLTAVFRSNDLYRDFWDYRKKRGTLYAVTTTAAEAMGDVLMAVPAVYVRVADSPPRETLRDILHELAPWRESRRLDELYRRHLER
jgi:predicted membrane chloride channel (bestrophin family)